MKIVTVIGSRPQFIKAAVVSRELRKKHKEIIVHTGQHFDSNMSELFFEELDLPKPDYNLGISGGSHAEMTGRMLVSIEKTLLREKPDWVLIYGDTNSTLAAALAAVKIHIKVCHVEAGNRTRFLTNPEEINRICSDHVSKLLLACTQGTYDELTREGLEERSVLVGDPMYDAFKFYSPKVSLSSVLLETLDGRKVEVPKIYNYLTCHREENTNRKDALLEIFKAMDKFNEKTVYPVHPRNKERALRIKNTNGFNNILLVEPVGYFESIALICNARLVVTDSGGVQREAFFARKKCLTVLDFAFWPETLNGNRNILVRPLEEEILDKSQIEQVVDSDYMPFGDGHAALKIVRALEEHLGDQL